MFNVCTNNEICMNKWVATAIWVEYHMVSKYLDGWWPETNNRASIPCSWPQCT